jgi:peptidoglycan/LPS O-acetylase OafA/YrhL
MYSNSSWESADEMAQLIQILGESPPQSAPAGRRFYQPELDGLRFYAFLGVFVYHTLPSQALFYQRLHVPLPGLWAAIAKSGTSGVDLFFALSAYLITSLLLRERQETGDISLRMFYLRRILRIWPLYFAVLALGVVLAHSMPEQKLPWYYVACYLLFIGNWISAIFGHTQSICSPLWTVSIEEQFYLVWPALMKMLERRGMIIVGVLTFLLATLSQAGIVRAGLSGGYIYYGSASRCDSLALGILLALFADRLAPLTSSRRWLLVGAGLSSWIAASAWLVEQPKGVNMRMVLGRTVVALASGAILYGSLSSRSRLLRGRWVVQLGKRSYGLYMLHLTGILIVQSLLRPAWGWQLLATKALGLAMTVILAFASYRWVESPFLRRKDHFATVLSRPV